MDSAVKEFNSRIKSKETVIAVVGLGYVGLPLAMQFARKGFRTLGIEIDKDRLGSLKKSQSYISDVGAKELKKVMACGNFIPRGEFSALREADVIIICVPTPLRRKYHPNISYIKSAVRGISGNIKKRAVIILESTTYPGTTEEVILPLLERRGLRHNRDFYLNFSPERIDPGNRSYPVGRIPKIVGGISKEAAFLAAAVYRSIINKVIVVSSARTAEAVKLLENTFRLINIAFIDEIAMMAHKMGIDVWEVIRGASTKPFGFMPFYPGPGVGGHCIPKDPLYLYWKARHYGFRSRFIKLASDTISGMPQYITERVMHLLKRKAPSKTKVLVIGATYKKDIRDLRQSPALDIIAAFHARGVSVSYYDPLIPYLKINGINLKGIRLNSANLKRFDCAVIATDHSALDYSFILKNSRLIFDTRNAYACTDSPKVVRL
ncbi:MAG: nucleotide sugar dehydrogenase [Candidatus Omnitrophota bacterium]